MHLQHFKACSRSALWYKQNHRALCGSVRKLRAMPTQAGQSAASSAPAAEELFSKIGDAHCHAQLDDDASSHEPQLKARCLAAMSVSSEDWQRVAQLAAASQRVIPCFGVHPWVAHKHANGQSKAGVTVADTLAKEPREGSDSITSEPLIQEWQAQLEERIASNPAAVVGEFGLDRIARVPGTGVLTSTEHQFELFREQWRIAARHQRPVSLHCVKAYGPLLDELGKCDAAACPPCIMLHSYSGSAEQVKDFLRVSSNGKHSAGASGDIGCRIYFSFSSVLSRKAPEKALARIRAVPEDRLLIETDMEDMGTMNNALLDIVDLVGEARGWSREQTVQQTWANFEAFYDGFMPEGTLQST